MSEKARAEILLILVAISWGLGFPVMKITLQSHDAFTVLWLRFLISLLTMLPFIYIKRRSVTARSIFDGVILGTLLFFTFAFFINGLNSTTSSSTGFLAGLAIVWVPIFEYLFFRKSLSTRTISSVIIAAIGLWIVSSPKGVKLETGHLLVVIGSIFSALHILSIDKLSKRSDPLTLTTIQITAMTLFSVLSCVIFKKELIPKSIDSNLINALLITSILATSLAFWVQTKFQSKTSPEKAAIIYNIEPVFAAFFSFLLLGEEMSTSTLIGGAIIFTAMTITSIPEKSASLESSSRSQN